MIIVNVIVDNKTWYTKVKSPKKYILNKLKKIQKFLWNPKNTIILTILLTKSLKLKKLNKKFRGKDKPTDVLSFPLISKKNFKDYFSKELYIGDIAISYEVINKRSVNKKNFLNEFNKVWVHGLLHLLGYDHIKDRDFSKMKRIEKKVGNLI